MFSRKVSARRSRGATDLLRRSTRGLAESMMDELEPVTGFRYDHVFKLVMVGESGVGKTCLAHRFACGSFLPEAPSTIGVDFCVRVMQMGAKRFKVQLWDTSGQESMRSIVPNYFRHAEAVILVYDSTDLISFNRLKEWLRLADQYSEPNTLVFIVGTKCDLVNKRVVSSAMLEDLTKRSKIPVYETSALRGEGVEDSFTCMVKALDSHLSVARVGSSFLLRRLKSESSEDRNCC